MARPTLLRDTRGGVAVEYLLFVTFVAIPVMIGLFAYIPRIVAHYQQQQRVLYQPHP